MVIVYEIAKYCNVSPSTVSKVLNNYDSIPETTRNKVLAAMKKLNYVPLASARELSKGKSFNVGILAYFGTHISPFKHSLFTNILDSFQVEMNAHNYDLLFISKNVCGKNETFLKNCITRHVDGVLLFGDTNEQELQEVINSNIPTVAFDYVGDKSSSVSSNNEELVTYLTEHLISLNHRRIAFIEGDVESKINQIRLNAYKKVLKSHNIPLDSDLIITSRYYETKNIKEILNRLLNLENKPTAIMFPDDYNAIKAIKEMKKIGLSCPNDISITGFDGIEVGQEITPSLTSAEQDVVNIGKTLAKELLKLMKNPSSINHYIIKGNVIIGESTAAVK